MNRIRGEGGRFHSGSVKKRRLVQKNLFGHFKYQGCADEIAIAIRGRYAGVFSEQTYYTIGVWMKVYW